MLSLAENNVTAIQVSKTNESVVNVSDFASVLPTLKSTRTPYFPEYTLLIGKNLLISKNPQIKFFELAI